MSYTEDPNINRRHTVADPIRSNTGMWIAGLIAVCIVVGLVAFATTRNSDTAMNTPATTTSAPAETTGSGAATPGTTPASPAKPMPNANAPAAPAKQ